MQYRIRDRGSDITGDQVFAVDRVEEDGSTNTVGYSSTLADAQEFVRRATDKSSHKDFFTKKYDGRAFGLEAGQALAMVGEQMSEEDAREARQHMRRIEAFREMFDSMLVSRVQPGTGPDLLYVTWEEFDDMHREYRQAALANEGKNFPFQPLSAYAHKLQRPNGKVIRPLFNNEVGVWTNNKGEARIIILKDQGPGDKGEKYFQVPDMNKGASS